MTIGLFGGSFNPPHLAHLIVAETMRERFGLDRVWWIPARQPPHKPDEELVEAEHRLAMTRLATDGNDAFAVSEVEVQRCGPSYTLDTVTTLQAGHPEHDFALLIGSDSLRDFGSWHKPKEIIARVPLLVYQRPDARMGEEDLAPWLEGRVRFAEAPLLQISGTDIRRRVHEGRSIRYLVPEPVRRYIDEHGLYREPS